jgi:thiazole synthase ThiGH ThiG subunit
VNWAISAADAARAVPATSIAQRLDQVLMAKSMRAAVEAGRLSRTNVSRASLGRKARSDPLMLPALWKANARG